MIDKLHKLIQQAAKNLNTEELVNFIIEHPDNIDHGDYSSNVALVLGKNLKKNPLTLAIELAAEIEKIVESDVELKVDIQKVEVAGIGFINFYLTSQFFNNQIKEIIRGDDKYGQSSLMSGKKVAIEYTDPNPFKQFHIGHLMTNIIGESIAGLYEWNGAEVKRFCYQGDVGRHVALTLWGMRFIDRLIPEESATLNEKTQFLGEAYALGSKKIEEEPEHEAEVQKINKMIYDRSDVEVNEIYDKGREWSLEHFEEIYEKLGTKFDQYFFESQATPVGLSIIKENIPRVFEESEGAIVFKGEKYDLHTRVFVTKEGLPTYEGKELGLAKIKYDTYKYDEGLVMTGNEQNDYFKVLLKVISLIMPEVAERSDHLSHGMLRFASGKMSSRTGDVITGESLINDMINSAKEKMLDRKFSDVERELISTQVAVGAIKYSILKQSIGKDIIFDKERSLSFEGDSGPYLQYSLVRARSVLQKAQVLNIEAELLNSNSEGNIGAELLFGLNKIIYRFPEIIEEALKLKAPQLVITYLTELAAQFNRFYAEQVILDEKEAEQSKARVALVSAFAIVMKNGLKVLGIPAPEKM